MFLGQSNNWIGIPQGFLGWGSQSGTLIPPAPYAVFSIDLTHILPSLSGLDYTQGLGPSADSMPFYLLGSGLSPAADNITITPSGTDFEIFNPNNSTYYSTTFTVPYTGSAITLSGFKVRAKAGLTPGSKSGTFTITAPNTSPFVLTCSGTVAAGTFIIASGGTITQVGDYKVHEILSTDIFDVTQIGSSPFNEVEYLIVAGGGAGGGYLINGGGGGAGGLLTASGHVVSIQSYTVIIGAGGSAPINPGTGSNGSNSSFDGLIAIGGGRGGENNISQPLQDGASGGSGGGAGSYLISGTGGGATIGQGYDGGSVGAYPAGNPNSGSGGGGGAGAPGETINGSSVDSGYGGVGVSSSITGTPTYYAGGGGGGAYLTNAGAGGLGGGGRGADSFLGAPVAGGVNTGGGGGGGSAGVIYTAASGGSGVVYISYYSPA